MARAWAPAPRSPPEPVQPIEAGLERRNAPVSRAPFEVCRHAGPLSALRRAGSSPIARIGASRQRMWESRRSCAIDRPLAPPHLASARCRRRFARNAFSPGLRNGASRPSMRSVSTGLPIRPATFLNGRILHYTNDLNATKRPVGKSLAGRAVFQPWKGVKKVTKTRTDPNGTKIRQV
jgi:hypothetical protein